jgi:hypothetical protein
MSTEPKGKAAQFLGHSAMGIRLGEIIGGRSWRRERDWDRTFSTFSDAVQTLTDGG